MTTMTATVLDVLTDQMYPAEYDVIAAHRSAFPLNQSAVDGTYDTMPGSNERKRLTAVYRALADCDLTIAGWTKSMNLDIAEDADVVLRAELNRFGNYKHDRGLRVIVDPEAVTDDHLRLMQDVLVAHGIPCMVTLQRRLLCAPSWGTTNGSAHRRLPEDVYRWLELGFSDRPHDASEEAYEYVAALMYPGSPLLSHDGVHNLYGWVRQPMSLEDARTVLNYGTTVASLPATLIDHGMTAGEAVRWLTVTGLGTGEILEWREAGFSVDDSAYWDSMLTKNAQRIANAQRIDRDVAAAQFRELATTMSAEDLLHVTSVFLSPESQHPLKLILSWAEMLQKHDLIGLLSIAVDGDRSIEQFDSLVLAARASDDGQSSAFFSYRLSKVLAQERSDDEVVRWMTFLSRRSTTYNDETWITSGWTANEAAAWAALMTEDDFYNPKKLYDWKDLLDHGQVTKQQVLRALDTRISAATYADVLAIMETTA